MLRSWMEFSRALKRALSVRHTNRPFSYSNPVLLKLLRIRGSFQRLLSFLTSQAIWTRLLPFFRSRIGRSCFIISTSFINRGNLDLKNECSGRDLNPGLRLERPTYLASLYDRSYFYFTSCIFRFYCVNCPNLAIGASRFIIVPYLRPDHPGHFARV